MGHFYRCLPVNKYNTQILYSNFQLLSLIKLSRTVENCVTLVNDDSSFNDSLNSLYIIIIFYIYKKRNFHEYNFVSIKVRDE